MLLPKTASEITLAKACPACLGNGGYGTRRTVIDREGHSAFQPCTTCGCTGWVQIPWEKITSELADDVRERLLPIPPDPEEGKNREDSMSFIRTSLMGASIDAVDFPNNSPREIRILSKGWWLSIHAQFKNGRFRQLYVLPYLAKPQDPKIPNPNT